MGRGKVPQLCPHGVLGIAKCPLCKKESDKERQSTPAAKATRNERRSTPDVRAMTKEKRTCEHNAQRYNCKKCGTHRRLLRGGFTSEQIKEMGAVKHCQFPGCLIQVTTRLLDSDHFHGENKDKINTENYRGELCRGHNILFADLDAHPEWADDAAKEFMARRPYSKLLGQLSLGLTF